MASDGEKRTVASDLKTIGSAGAVVAALAVALVALVLAIRAGGDSASSKDVSQLRDDVEVAAKVADEARTGSEDFSGQLDDLTGRLETVESRQEAVDADIAKIQKELEDIQSRITTLEAGGKPPAPGQPAQ
jgi:TolA-binding protein